jgi:hypothetical protein
VISLSLKAYTLFFSIAVSATLLLMLYQSCRDGPYICTVERWPMISDIILQEMYTRIFILMMAVFMYGIQQANLRAFYKKLYGKASDQVNDATLLFGLISTVIFPLIGIFDESQWMSIHGYLAGAFFISFLIYSILLG